MRLDKEDEARLKKLGASSCIDLALIVPHTYEDLRLHANLQAGAAQLIDATVNSIVKTPHSIKINLYVHNFSHSLEAVIFKPKPYMSKQFVQGERYFLYGVINCSGGHCIITHPKKITNAGIVTPRYKTALRNDTMMRFMQKHLTWENLRDEGIKEEYIEKILDVHFPKAVIPYRSKTGLLKEYIDSFKYLELYDNLKRLTKKKRHFPCKHKFLSDYDKWQESLPFVLTDEQLSAIEDIKEDFSKDVAAKRMIVGDVGSGKTMVMFASVMMARPYKAVLMAPTTLLANQLYEEALKFLPDLKTVLVTNKTSKVDLGEYDFIVGTHALLYRELPDISLVMIDEQHRFGTAQRSLLDKLASEGESRAHVLQFSATPIPRTQAMIQSAHIDVSLIIKTPFKKDITTHVIGKNDFSKLLEHIKEETTQGRQVLLVYPLVEESEAFNYQSINEARSYWEDKFDNVYVTHGKDKEKEKVLLDFRDNGDILIATTVVEVGISLPRLSTVVIVGAERLGLSTLHQLRGRVSRTGLKGYCYLFTYQSKSERLKQFCTTQNGFDIAELDLKFRKSGDLLKGVNQSGSEFKWIDFSEDEEIVKEVKKDLNI
ncbi:ATP-dependent DNA helicase RecG [Sulfurimonas sp. HSL-1716]|uniref:ATP-dependent DNA helicase RecG n=1 Tax=Hydrocurvibacter sulfurireducens TaxID=3131937 RepID=UPI0031F94A12